MTEDAPDSLMTICHRQLSQKAKKTPKMTGAQRQKNLQERAKAKLLHLQLQLEDLTMQLEGFLILPPPADLTPFNQLKEQIDNFKERYIERTRLKDRQTITGSFSQIPVDHDTLDWISQSPFFVERILPLSERIFRSSLSREDLEVKIHQGAILTNPLLSDTSTPQKMHADNIGFISLIVIIMMTPGGGESTHIIPRRLHGNDYDAPRHDFLRFTFNNKCNADFDLVRTDIQHFYGKLLKKKPPQLFGSAYSCDLPYGGIEIFRSDLFHAGPFSKKEREVLFLELRVKDEVGPDDHNYQFGVDELNEIIQAKPKAPGKRGRSSSVPRVKDIIKAKPKAPGKRGR